MSTAAARPPRPAPPPPELSAAEEDARLAALQELKILRTAPEERFDRITRLAAQVFEAPIALVSFLERETQWFKSTYGLNLPGTSRRDSFCAHAVVRASQGEERSLVIPDARRDIRFAGNALVVGEPFIRSYAGQVILAPGGQPMGTICVLDRRRRTFEQGQLSALRDLAELVEEELHNVELNALVTRLRASEERMREAEGRYREIFENLATGVYQSTLDGRYLNANPALARIHGYSTPEEMMTRVTNIAAHVYVDPHRRADMLRRLDEQGDVQGFEAEVFRQDGSTLWISQNVHRVCDPTGQFVCYMGSVEDITSRRYAALAQEQAAQAAMHNAQLKSEFLSTMSHEIRTPMHGIIGMANLLAQTGLNPEQDELARLIATCGDNLLGLINNVLDFSKIESGAMEIHLAPHELSACLREVVAPLNIRATECRVTLSYEVDPRIPQVLVSDAGWVRQILNNLVGNAIKFTPAGGRVDVSVTGNPLAASDLPEHVARALEPYPGAVPWMFHFTVRDTGIGVPEEKLHRLFKPFSQADAATSRKYGGTGLGLAICHRLCEMLGGSIWLESEVGEGSSFEFTLKAAALPGAATLAAVAAETTLSPSAVTQLLATAAGAATPSPPELPANALASLRILLTEDNSVNQRVALGLLRQIGRPQGADAIANHGGEAVAAVESQTFDVILMDVQMPEMDGFEATRQVRRRFPDRGPYIIAMTANAMEGDREKCLAAGMDDYLSKPVKAAQLQAALEKAILAIRNKELGVLSEAPTPAPLPSLKPLNSTPPQAVTTPLTPAALDRESLQALRNLAAEDDEEFFKELVDLFLTDAASRLNDLDRTLASGQAADFTRAAHSVKGACANFGATDLATLCAKVEQHGRAGDLPTAALLLPGVREELERVRLALTAEMA